jgi:FkbM family methyltransferase
MSEWNQVRGDLRAAAEAAPVGAELPGLSRYPLAARVVGRLFARVVFGSARPLTDRQRRYNEALLRAAGAVADAAEHLEAAGAAAAAKVAELEARLAAADAAVTELRHGIKWLTDEAWRVRRFSEPFYTRPDTMDAEIRDEVVWGREYRLPDRFAATDVMIDIGTHIGSFSFACLVRGAGAAAAFEVDPRNHALAATNLARFGHRSELYHKAVWRSDGRHSDLRFNASQNPLNTGGGGVHDLRGGVPVPWVALDDVITGLTARRGVGRVRMIKIDCEGSEFPILFTATKLHLVDEICGEYHEIPDHHTIPEHYRVDGWDRFNRHTLTELLTRNGFAVERVDGGNTLGLFFAKRRK